MNSIAENKPKGTWKYKKNNSIVIGTSTRSPAAFFSMFFCIVMLSWIPKKNYGLELLKQILIGEIDTAILTYGIIYLFAFIIVLSVALRTIAGKIEVVIGANSYVFTGIGKIGIKNNINWDLVKNIYETKRNQNQVIIIEEKKQLIFGSELNDERRFYLVTTLQYLLKKGDI